MPLSGRLSVCFHAAPPHCARPNTTLFGLRVCPQTPGRLKFPTSLCGVLVFWLPSRPPLPSAAFRRRHRRRRLRSPTHPHPLHIYISPPSHTYSSISSSSPLPVISSQQITILILFTSPTHIISTDHHPHQHHQLLQACASSHTPLRFGVCCLARARRSTQSPQKGLLRALSPLVPLAVLVAGAVSRASRRGCGARCRRWCRWLPSAWQAHSPKPPEGVAARVVAAGAAGCPLAALALSRASSSSLLPLISSQQITIHTNTISPVSHPTEHHSFVSTAR